ncbi:reverse transcriptase domain, Reverse transcriptase zinc-binding domain protein [Artemisia annua]|uniref:Reverse transcriptase domain, Reverse transcriptase zinc-binding domain protein n=1 Tax=Artemisia annua TaxID=35608 RepID=A0A2U1LQ26_ARTAN|nr:reverse transcriptase domain, Reverse transcriptase zinc-binding domain protein [Artemisia annua]
MPFRGNMSWSWRKILQLRPLVRNFIWYKLGDGSKALAWFDSWCSLSPLANIVSSRDVHRAGFCPTTTVRDIITPNGWAWPSDWVIATDNDSEE